MKKLLIILPCVIALFGCDKINFYETNIECISPIEQATKTDVVHFDSIKVNSKKAILKTGDNVITLKRYASKEYPDFAYYKNEKTNEIPAYFHYSKNVYGIGMAEDKLTPCYKISNVGKCLVNRSTTTNTEQDGKNIETAIKKFYWCWCFDDEESKNPKFAISEDEFLFTVTDSFVNTEVEYKESDTEECDKQCTQLCNKH